MVAATNESIANRDYTLILDKSGSMVTADVGGKTRWDACREATVALAHKLTSLDPDGITLYTFNNAFKRYESVTPARVDQVFQENEPFGGTELSTVLKHAFADFQSRKVAGKLKGGDTILVVTDGEPSDREQVARTIIEATKHLDRDEELAVQFLQVGKDTGAKAFLEKLDNELTAQGAKFDIVDTKTFDEIEQSGMTMSEVLLAAIND